MASMPSKLNEKLAIAFLFFVGLAVFFWPILFSDKVIDDHYALYMGHYKFISDFSENLSDGEVKLWWSNYLGGFPVYLTQMGLFNPLIFIFSKFLEGLAVNNWITFLNFVLTGIAMYWFSRELSLSKIASLFTGLAYTISQNNLYWGAITHFSSVYLFVPLFFLALLKISKGQKIWWFWGGLIAGYGLALANIQIVFYTFVIGFFWALFLKYKIKNWKPVWGYFSIGAFGAVLASFWLLPVLNYLKLTIRSSALSFADLSFDFMRIADPLRFFYPYIQLPQFTGFVSLGIAPSYYIGALTFLLAIAAIFLVRKNKIIAFWVGVAAFSLIVRIKWTGIFWVLHFLPGFNRFRGVFHWAFISSFALALLAGFVLDNLEEIKKSPYFKKFVGALKIFGFANIAAVLGVFSIFLFRDKILAAIFKFFDEKVYSQTRQFPLEHYHNVIVSELDKFLSAFSLSNYHFVISFLSVLIAILIFVLYQKGKINFDNFKKTALIFTFLNLTLIWQGYYDFIPQSKITNYPDTVSFIKNHYPEGERYRFFRFYPPESYQEFEIFDVKDWADYQLKTLEFNTGIYFDMDTFGGLEPFLSGRIADIYNKIGLETPTSISGEPWLRSTKLSLSEKIEKFSSPENINLLSMLNIKYVFSSFKLNNLKLVYETTATEKNIPVYIYENSAAMPRIYFAKNVKYVNPENVFEELLKVKDFRNLSLIECQKDCPESKLLMSDINNLKLESQLVKVKTSGGGWLIYSDANLPTWEAYIDGQKTEIYTANYLFKSVFVPMGEHEVIFKYPNLWGQYRAAIKNLIRR